MPQIYFNGPAGRIEGVYTKSADPAAPLALVLHPHPLYEGTMNNKIVYNSYRILADNGFTVLRINFRGVGRSQGKFDNGVGEVIDAATALDWLQQNNPNSGVNLILGFSFGAWIAMQLVMRRPEINYFIAISPPVNKYDFSFLSPCPIPGFILQGDNDSIVSVDEVRKLANKLSKQQSHIKVDYKIITGADHFFRYKTDEFTAAMNKYLKSLDTNTHYQNANNNKNANKNSNKLFLY
ncbi:alpha/beta hydrolase [Rickettsia endosymbiont of Halotydeus destructor]|uniref:alpha/beta hydrolase n=1 Tax=Rickettsia endosymbiont of Halotydeus destructor TaxID=2996754 RepID=UPI003BAFB40C